MAKKPLRLNFTDTGTTFEPWNVGEEYDFTVNSVKEGISSTGNAVLEFEFKHMDSNRKVWKKFSLQEQALWVLKSALIAMGVESDELEGEWEFDPDELLGSRVKLTFDEPVKQVNGKTYQNISGIISY